MWRRVLLLATALLAFVAATHAASYKTHQRVPVFVNNVGPFHNPAESYRYYSLPYCEPKRGSEYDSLPQTGGDDLGETLAGDRRRPALYDLRFATEVQWASLCRFRLSQNEIKQFRDAIAQHYVFEMFVDELGVKGFVGEMERSSARFERHVHNETHFYLFTHLDFSVAYNGAHVIAVNLTTDPQQRLELEFGKDLDVEFSYSVHWHPTHVKHADRLSLHSRKLIGDQSLEVHWLSIINSFVLVLLLTALLGAIVMRALHKDLARYMELDSDDGDAEAGEGDMLDESGWKLVHGDVFRVPPASMLLTCAVGNGAQILVLILAMLTLALIGTFYPGSSRGALYSAILMFYALTTFVAGYVATGLYLRLGGTKWASSSLLTACLFALPTFVAFSVCNSVAWSYGSSSALPAQTIVLLFLLWALVSFPLTIFGSLRARAAHQASGGKALETPCKTNRVEREIPPAVWWRSAWVQALVAGCLPFSACYIELHYVFLSVWGHAAYTLYGLLFLAFILLLVVSAFVSLALVYFQLSGEDWRWWWRSFSHGASVGAFMYAYAIFYWCYRSQMSGALQATFYFLYTAIIALAFALALGTLSFVVSLIFVRKIYASIKVD